MRGHTPVTIEVFNGLFRRGPQDACPLDHFTDCNNIQYVEKGFKTRDGVDVYLPYKNVRHIYTYIQQGSESLIILDTSGNFYHSTSPTPFTPILSIPAAEDFSCLSVNGRAYISPHAVYGQDEYGLQNDYIYVYKGDGTPARRAGGTPPKNADGALAATNSGTAGNVEAGFHLFAVVYETDTGFLTQIGPDTFASVTAPGNKKVHLANIPVSPNSYVVARQIVATQIIPSYTGDQKGYTFYFVPGGRIADNTTTTLDVNFFDADLVDEASHLFDLFENIPAGVGLSSYHNRMISWAEYNNISLIRISNPGEPEAFDQVSGLLIVPLDGNPLTQVQEFRDVLYAFKKNRTVAYNDNGGDPSSWPLTILDQGIGTPSSHGIGTVLDSGGISADYLAIVSFTGIILFNGTYIRPELSFKIRDFIIPLVKANYIDIQVVNDTVNQMIYITLLDNRLLVGDYSNGLDPKNIRWSIWSFNFKVSTITLINTNQLILGATQSE